MHIDGILTDISYLGHERACRKIRSVLDKTGEIDGFFVNSFKSFAAWLKEPIIALQTLIDFLESVCRGGSELVAPTGSDPATPSASAQNVVSLGAIMHPAGPVGHARTSSTASERGGVSTVYDDLKAAATAGATSPRYSPFPSPDPMQIPEHPPLSPSFFDIDTDTDTHAHPTTAHPTTTTTANTGIIDPSTHTHIHNPEPALRALPTPTNPSWKLALSNRHPLHTLFVGTHELQVFARCLYLAQKAMVKAEECISVIEECRYLAIRMEKEWAMWDESCTEMREALDQKKVDEGEAGGEGLEQRGNADGWWGEGCGGEKGWVGK